MAESKRAQGEAEEKYTLPVPPFEPEAYVRREVLYARAAVVLAIYGLLLGQLGAILAVMLRNSVASLGVFFFGLTALKGILEVTGIGVADWDRKTWLTHVALLFFTWLAAWIVFSNRPFVA